MNTEMTVIKDSIKGEVFFDAECRLCSNGVRRWGGVFAARGFHWLPLQTPGLASRLGVSSTDLRTEMKLRTAEGCVVGGVDAWAILFRAVWWLWPLGLMMSLPGLHGMSVLVYRWIARNRYCLNGHCEVPKPRAKGRGLFEAGIFLTLLLFAAGLTWGLSPWVLMWSLAFVMFIGCKWITFRNALREGVHPGFSRTLTYLIAWPGMDAHTFLNTKARPGSVLGATNLVFGLLPIIYGWAALKGEVL